MIPICYQVSAMQRYSESLAKSVAYAPDANLAAADNTSSYYAFERKFLGVVMNLQPGMMYWNGGDGDESEKSGDEPGLKVYSFFNATGALGIGGMFDIGIVEDSDGNTSQYLSIGWALGYGGTFGSGFSTASNNKHIPKLDDYFGWSQGVNLQLAGPLSFEAYQDLTHGAVYDYHGQNYKGMGANVGYGSGWFGYQAYTFKINIDIPRDFWSNSIHAK